MAATPHIPGDYIAELATREGIAREALADDPDLQQSLAEKLNYPPSKWLLEQEAAQVAQRRALHDDLIEKFRSQNAKEDIYDWARRQTLTGICLSGGGIRSATFNLGVLQGIASKGGLEKFDYLSSVSGGGYIHAWLAGWLKRETVSNQPAKDPHARQKAWKTVMAGLIPLPQPPSDGPARAEWPHQIQWLRRYSNYLTPRKGLLTGDTWSAVASWLRNVAVNQGLLIALFLVILALPHFLALPRPLVPRGDFSTQLEAYFSPTGHAASSFHWLSLAVLLVFFVACASVGYLLRLEFNGRLADDQNQLPARHGDSLKARFRRWQVGWAMLLIVLPLLCFGLLLTYLVCTQPGSPRLLLALFGLLLLLVWTETFSGGAIGETQKQKQDERSAEGERGWSASFCWKVGHALFFALLGAPAAVAGALLGALIAALVTSVWMLAAACWLGLPSAMPVQVVVGTLLFFWLPPLTMVLASGMIGRNFPTWLGEWLARIRGYTLLAGLGWIFLVGCSLLSPGALEQAWGWIKWPAVFTWLGTTLGGVLAGKSGKTSGDASSSSGLLEKVVIVAPYVYIAGLAVLLSWVLDRSELLIHDKLARSGDLWLWAAIVVSFTLFTLTLGWRLDINQFSMHSFYRHRLTRCYLGASNLHRNPSPITGFDERDSSELMVAQLTVENYPGPIPLFCCAMNITTGEDLAWQERKAASFVFSPLYSGYSVAWTAWKKHLRVNGFLPSFMLYPGGPSVAAAMATSGAAASPNMGYHTKPATAFLMTMFDVRLGLWVPNPRCSNAAGMNTAAVPKKENEKKQHPDEKKILKNRSRDEVQVPPASPRFALGRMLSELTGSVDDTSTYVYLTDGGHFDNMGLYELVRRRCYDIVICDGEEDGDYVFQGLGDAIRKCRIDFGAEIELDMRAIKPEVPGGLSGSHIAQGTIRYPETPAGEYGRVLYVKASLTPKTAGKVELPEVPGDVQNYKLQHQPFPHDPTANQWFTESQFESYRRLGQAIVDRIC